MRMPILITLAGSASAATGTAAVPVFLPAGGAFPVSFSVTMPLTLAGAVNLGLRGDVLLFPGLGAPPALSALLGADPRFRSALTPYAGAGIGTASVLTKTGWAVHPTWTAVAGMRAAVNDGVGLSVEARASRAALGLAVGLTLQTPTGSWQ